MPTNVDLSQFHGTNNLLLRKKAKKIMDQVQQSDNPISVIDGILDQAVKAYSVDNKYLHIQAEVILQALFTYLRANKFDITHQQSMKYMRKTQGALNQIKEAKKRDDQKNRSEKISGIKDKVTDMVSPFIPTPRTLLNSLKIQNPMLGAVMDSASNMFGGGGDKNASLFDDMNDTAERVEEVGSESSSQLTEMNGAMIEIMVEQLDVLNELLRFTKKVWGDASDNLEDIANASEEQVERLEDIDEEAKRQNFEDAERIREAENDRLSPDGLGGLADTANGDNGLGLEDVPVGAAFLGGGALGAALKGAKSIGRFLTRIPVIGSIINGAFALLDAYDPEKNKEIFGKAELEGSERASAVAANFLGGFVDIVDTFLGTDLGPKVRKNTFDSINGIVEKFNGMWTDVKEDFVTAVKEPTTENILQAANSLSEQILFGATGLVDSIFGTDITGFTKEILHEKIDEAIGDVSEATGLGDFFRGIREEGERLNEELEQNKPTFDWLKDFEQDAKVWMYDALFGDDKTEQSLKENVSPSPKRNYESLREERNQFNTTNNVTNINQNNINSRQEVIKRELREPFNNEIYLQYGVMG